MPTSGPSSVDIRAANHKDPDSLPYALVRVTPEVVDVLALTAPRLLFTQAGRHTPKEIRFGIDTVDVRVIARVKQAMSFDPNGKPVVSGDDGWVIRNISFPYRAAPIKEDPQMYEIQARDPDVTLAPGRYALVERDYAYDFTVAGTVTDKRQCLERIAAANGTFYAECGKP